MTVSAGERAGRRARKSLIFEEKGLNMPTGTTSRAQRAGTRVANVTAEESRGVASQATDEARGVASTAAEQGGALVQTAKQDVRSLVETAKERAGGLTGEISAQGRSLVQETRSQLEAQAQSGVQRFATGFRQLGEQAQALAEGRPDEAPQLTEYVTRAADGLYGAADRMFSVADDVETRGISGLLDDLQQFARRRPGAFLLGATVLGFGVGRLVKAEKARAAQEQAVEEPEPTQSATDGNGRARRQPLLTARAGVER